MMLEFDTILKTIEGDLATKQWSVMYIPQHTKLECRLQIDSSFHFIQADLREHPDENQCYTLRPMRIYFTDKDHSQDPVDNLALCICGFDGIAAVRQRSSRRKITFRFFNRSHVDLAKRHLMYLWHTMEYDESLKMVWDLCVPTYRWGAPVLSNEMIYLKQISSPNIQDRFEEFITRFSYYAYQLTGISNVEHVRTIMCLPTEVEHKHMMENKFPKSSFISNTIRFHYCSKGDDEYTYQELLYQRMKQVLVDDWYVWFEFNSPKSIFVTLSDGHVWEVPNTFKLPDFLQYRNHILVDEHEATDQLIRMVKNSKFARVLLWSVVDQWIYLLHPCVSHRVLNDDNQLYPESYTARQSDMYRQYQKFQWSINHACRQILYEQPDDLTCLYMDNVNVDAYIQLLMNYAHMIHKLSRIIFMIESRHMWILYQRSMLLILNLDKALTRWSVKPVWNPVRGLVDDECDLQHEPLDFLRGLWGYLSPETRMRTDYKCVPIPRTPISSNTIYPYQKLVDTYTRFIEPYKKARKSLIKPFIVPVSKIMAWLDSNRTCVDQVKALQQIQLSEQVGIITLTYEQCCAIFCMLCLCGEMFRKPRSATYDKCTLDILLGLSYYHAKPERRDLRYRQKYNNITNCIVNNSLFEFVNTTQKSCVQIWRYTLRKGEEPPPIAKCKTANGGRLTHAVPLSVSIVNTYKLGGNQSYPRLVDPDSALGDKIPVVLVYGNKHPGGGVLGHGAVQEEMIVSEHFTSMAVVGLDDNMSPDSGEVKAILCTGNRVNAELVDKRLYTCTPPIHLLFLDAHNMKDKSYAEKLNEHAFMNLKMRMGCYLAQRALQNPVIIGGAWGCGAFGNDLFTSIKAQMDSVVTYHMSDYVIDLWERNSRKFEDNPSPLPAYEMTREHRTIKRVIRNVQDRIGNLYVYLKYEQGDRVVT